MHGLKIDYLQRMKCIIYVIRENKILINIFSTGLYFTNKMNKHFLNNFVLTHY